MYPGGRGSSSAPEPIPTRGLVTATEPLRRWQRNDVSRDFSELRACGKREAPNPASPPPHLLHETPAQRRRYPLHSWILRATVTSAPLRGTTWASIERRFG